MTTLALTLAPPRRISRTAYEVLLVLAGSLLVAGLAQLSIKLPFTPVPITGQTLGVLLVGASLGPMLGGASLLLYVAEGAVGLPFFAGGQSGWHGLFAPSAAFASAGYLWGFVVAAFVVGWLSRRGWDRSFRSSIGAMFFGEVILYVAGVWWLVAALHVPVEKGLQYGLYPFVIGDVLKLLIAAGLLPASWRLAGRRGSS